MLNHYNLGCSRFGLKSLMISWTTGVIWLKFENLIASAIVLYLCSYNLDGSVTAGIGARFNTKHINCVFKTKVFVKTLN
jgi:hypothetical protein